MPNTSDNALAARTAVLVDGWPISIQTLEAAVSAIADRAETHEPFTVFTLNLDHIVKLRRDAHFREAYRSATLISADGAPIAWLARRQGADVSRTTGADLAVPLSIEAARRQIPIYLFGSTAAVLGKAARRLGDYTDGLIDIAGTDAPPNGFDPEGPEADAAIAKIAASGARIAYIALGAPKQELFAARAKAQGVRCGFVCVGAALDFLAGTQIRAPRWMQQSGSEWVWRLGTNPRRLAARYRDCIMIFADLTIIQPIRQRFSTGF